MGSKSLLKTELPMKYQIMEVCLTYIYTFGISERGKVSFPLTESCVLACVQGRTQEDLLVF